MHSGQRQSITVTTEPRKTVEVDIEHVQAAALTGRQSDKRTAMRPPEFPNCRRIRSRVLEAMWGRWLFIGQAGKHREDFASEQNGLHGKSRVQRGLDFADWSAPHRSALRAAIIACKADAISLRSHRLEPGPTWIGAGYLPAAMPR